MWSVRRGCFTGRTAAAQAYRLVRSVLAQAVRDGLIPTNPAQVKGAATAPHPERLPLDPPAVAALAAAVPARYRAAVLVAAWSGTRPGQVFALRRADVGADGAVQVARTLVEIPGPSQMSVGERLIVVRITGPVRRFIFQGRKRTGGRVGVESNRRRGYRGGTPNTVWKPGPRGRAGCCR